MNIQQPPFPPDTEIEVFFEIGQLTFHFITIISLIILMLYCYRAIKDILPIIVIYGFSLIIGMNSIAHGHEPFTPIFEIFFLVFQSTLMIIASVDYYHKK